MEKLSNQEAEEFLNRYTTSLYRKYPWDEWFDMTLGEWCVLAKDIDFTCSLTSMRNQLYRQGDKRKIRLEVLLIKAGETVSSLKKDCVIYRQVERDKRVYYKGEKK
tara:strand:+ start:177 stop:494 length:318 start_codon:yes stop_codon:yes gene_type:complete